MSVNPADVLAIARETLQDDDLQSASALIDAKGYDSLTHIRFVLALQQRYAITIGENEVRETSTVAEVAAIAARKRV